MTSAAWIPRIGGASPTLADVSEEDVLGAFASALRVAPADIGPGDDAAVLAPLAGRVVVTTDSMVSELDWRDDWSSPQEAGRKVVAQNIADIVAMGARPVGVVVALAAERTTRVDWVVALTEGMSQELERAGTGVLGGDLSGLPGGVVVTITALGELAPDAEPLLRSQATGGDLLVVSDRLGRSHAGLLLLRGRDHEPPSRVPGAALAHPAGSHREGGTAMLEKECMAFHRAPWPRYGAGEEARAAGMRCALDVSDGLVRDARRIARASRVTIDLDAAALQAMAAPLAEVVEDRALECVLGGGEEHALLGTCRPGHVPPGWYVIGRVLPEGSGSRGDVLFAGRSAQHEGWDHFGG